MAIITSVLYPSIRAAIDTELDTNSLPDATIALDIYATAADNDVLKLDPIAESRTGDEQIKIQNAAVFFCAARLVTAIRTWQSQTITARDLNISRIAPDPNKRADELRGKAEEEISDILEPSAAAPQRPFRFARVQGIRGR